MTLETIQIDTGANPTVSVIWMHGLGADGNDFVPIVKELDLSGCPAIRFIFPNAPSIPVSINGGAVMPAWYDIRNSDITSREDAAGLRASQLSIEELIAQENARGAKKIILAGFSQGCAMTLQTGLRQGTPLAGLLCLSGYLPLPQTLEAERNLINQQVPIYMAHGRVDPVIAIQRAKESRDLLIKSGYQVEWHEYNMPHSVCLEQINDMAAWLTRVLA